MKTKGNGQKQTENKAETKLAKLLKTQEAPEKQSENKPKNEAGHVVENKGSKKQSEKPIGDLQLIFRFACVASKSAMLPQDVTAV